MRPGKFGLAAGIAALAVVSTLPTFAQDDDPPAIAARIAYLSGNVSLEAQGAQDWSVAPLNYPMVSGDRVYTDQGARAAIQCGATDVRVAGGTDVTLTNLNEQYEQIGIAQGSIRVRVYAIDPDNTIEVDTPSGAVIIQNPGDYRVNVYPDQQASLVQVNSGTVQITGPGVNQEVDQGEAVQLYGTNPVEVGVVDMPGYDALDTWSINRDRHIQGSVSARYVSHWVPGYDDLDDNGDWTPASDYGPIWFPRSVAAGWQPYTTGHWAYVAPWGYTWVDDAPWGYAPFHYGRWVQWQGRWGWVPGPPAVRPVYAPAFVAFVGGGPGVSVGVSFGGGGVAAWFPLGVAEPFVPWYHCSPRYVRTVNVTNVNITVIHNVTVVNNYNTFITHVSNVRTVNEIQVNNINYVNRTRVVAVRADTMTSGARVQQAAFHLNPQQQQALARAPMAAVGRPPVAAPPHPMAGVRANVSRPAARPVLMTPHGRAAATPTSNAAHFSPRTLPKPTPPTALKPATRAVVPNVHPAAPGAHPVNNAARPGTPANNAVRPGQPVNNAARPATPANTAPRPGTPANTAARPGQPVNNATRPGQPANNPARPGAPVNNAARPGQPANNAAHPTPEVSRPGKPLEQPANRPGQPANNARPAAPAPNHPATPVRPETSRPAPETRPVPESRTPPARPEAHPAPQPARPETRPAQPARPAPEAHPQPGRPAPQAHPAPNPKNPPPNRKEEKKPPKEENPPQR